MNKVTFFIIGIGVSIVLLLFRAEAQVPGEWMWMNGPNTWNAPAVFGVQGVPSAANHPPSLYESVTWTDLQGNFWLYGGIEMNNYDVYAALWKYDPSVNMWTWVNGLSTPNHVGQYGIKGVSSPANSPGSITWGTNSWTDSTGNLWMVGGGTHMSNTRVNALWKYEITTNVWTWVSGDNFVNSAGNSGVMGVPSASNVLPARGETTISWKDAYGNFWLFGGQSLNGMHDDVWKYDPVTNEWTWMCGSNFAGATPEYGTLGVEDVFNTPGGRMVYGCWKDKSDNFWLYGGYQFGGTKSDLWKFNLSTNAWTWMGGSNVSGNPGLYGEYCDTLSSNDPGCRLENKSCWTDTCGYFWMFGGKDMSLGNLNDLWRYSPYRQDWKWVSGDSTYNPIGNYGSFQVSSPNNMPDGRDGACSWMDMNGHLWLFGGLTGIYCYSDMWRFVPPLCASCELEAVFSAPNQFCPGSCISFTNNSIGASSYYWSFPGAIPSSSMEQEPDSICYLNPGTYDVELIAFNGNDSDTILMSNYINVFPFPASQSITRSGDTLFAINNATSYQWYFNGNAIAGATQYYYLATQSGNYQLIATDEHNCEVEVVLNNVIAGVQRHNPDNFFSITPNPVVDVLFLISPKQFIKVQIYDVTGRLQLTENLKSRESFINVEFLQTGIYFLKMQTSNEILTRKFLKD